MQVQMKIGPKAGEVVDLPYVIARDLVLMDQAEDVTGQMRLSKPTPSRIDAESVEGSAPMGEVHAITPEPQHVPMAEVHAQHASKKKRK